VVRREKGLRDIPGVADAGDGRQCFASADGVEERPMSKGLRITLWVLSSLAVVWTVSTLVGLAGMRTMMSSGMMRPGGTGETMPGMMGDGMMMGMMLHMALTWIIMLGLVGVFIYLIVTARRVQRITDA
jgi:hypothetical protein